MKRAVEKLTRPEFGWFDLVFVVVAFTLTRDELSSPAQTLAFFAIGAVIGAEHVWLRPRIRRRRREARP